MKTPLCLLILMLSTSCYATTRLFSVAGVGSNGKTLAGEVELKDDNKNVSTDLVDENGKSYNFKGKWKDNGEIVGKTDNGISVELSTEEVKLNQ